jgi:DNA-binding NarL/FixJ family response regulator
MAVPHRGVGAASVPDELVQVQMKAALHILVSAETSARRSRIAELVRGQFSFDAVEMELAPGLPAFAPHEPLPDLWIADLSNPAAASRLLRAIEEFRMAVAMVVLIDDPEPHWVKAGLEAGIHAIMNRDPEPEELRLALAAAEAGLILLHPSSARGLVSTMLATAGPQGGEIDQLTAREREVLRLVSDGLGNKEIANALGISEHTAKFHISSILGKLNASGRAEAVSQGIRRGLIPI